MRNAIVLLLCLICSIPLFPQATEGTILGTVSDVSGGAVPGATVRVTNVGTGIERRVETDSSGEYVVTNLSLGSYRVVVEAKGFQRLINPPVAITVKARVRVDGVLQVGEVTQEVNVSAFAAMIKTDTPELGGVVLRQVLQEIPIISRNFLALAGLVPGTTNGPPSSRQRDFSGASVTISGASAEANNFIIDGISDNMEFSGAIGVVPPMDAIQEFAIQTSQYSAEFGRSGGGVVNVAIKSGTNDFHGFAYDYLRNDKLDARPFDFTGTNPRKTPIRRNQFGAGVGGPIFKNRVFFFTNYEGLRFPNNTNQTVIVPKTAQKAGDFTQSGFTIYDPTTAHVDPANPSRTIRDPFSGNHIPSNRLDAIGVELLSYYPNPNYTDANPKVRNNYLVTNINRDKLDSFNVKGDYAISAKNSMTTRFSQQFGGRDRSSWMPDNVIGATAMLNGANAGITFTHVFSPTLLNEARAGYNYLRFGNELLNHNNVLDQFNIPNYNTTPFSRGYPSVSIANISGASIVRPIASVPTPFFLVEHSYQYMDNMSWQKGSHAIKFGGEIGRVHNNRFQGRPGGGGLTFNATYTTQVVGSAVEAARNGVADTLLGLASAFYTNYSVDGIRIHSKRYGGFFQDDWRATRKLTLSLGLRYDYYGPYTEEQNRFTRFDLATGQRVMPISTKPLVESQLKIPGGNLPAGWRYDNLDMVVPHSNYKNFAPRFGFAYAFNNRLALRGGYGLFYAVTVSNNANNSGTDGNPFYSDFSLPADLNNPIVVRNGFPAGGLYGAISAATFGSYYTPLDRHDPYTQKYSLNLQISTTSRTALDVGYSGQRALGFPTLAYMNVPLPGAGTIQTRRPYPHVGNFTGYLPVNDSNYNGLEAAFRLKEYNGLAAQSAFTFSKSLGYTTGTDGGVLANPYDH
jgi:outer membrane receptor protein involved in Fe transport